ncbi:MAG: ABC transporter substrate-binding protein [Desulfobacteraceae bacterium]|nr:MAG: ABC transporter substrate-binding protein [Desulfobacteraceae bacterium]
MKKIMLFLSAALMVFFFQALPQSSASGAGDADRTLKVALLPILDSLPFHVAEEKGIFSRLGVGVRFMPVASAIERDQLMQSDRIDGMLTELNTTAVFNRTAVRIRIVRFARVAYPDYPLFRILAAPGSGVRTAADLRGIGIGIAKNTVVEYVTDRLLAAKGLKPEEVVKQSVPVIPERFQLLMQGRIKAAVLPDPLAKSAMEAGAVEVVADSEHPQYGVSVLAFRTETLKSGGESVRLFLRGWDEAAAWINEHPEESREVLLKRIPMPENVRTGYRIPPFPRNGVPAKEQWKDVTLWMQERGLIDAAVSYEDSVTSEFIGKPAPPASK